MVSSFQCHATGKKTFRKVMLRARVFRRQVPKLKLEPRSVQTATAVTFQYWGTDFAIVCVVTRNSQLWRKLLLDCKQIGVFIIVWNFACWSWYKHCINQINRRDPLCLRKTAQTDNQTIRWKSSYFPRSETLRCACGTHRSMLFPQLPGSTHASGRITKMSACFLFINGGFAFGRKYFILETMVKKSCVNGWDPFRCATRHHRSQERQQNMMRALAP